MCSLAYGLPPVSAIEIQEAQPPQTELEAMFVSQPEPAAPAFEAAPATAGSSQRRSARSSYARLSRAPNMFGDSLNPSGQIMVTNGGANGSQRSLVTDLPLGNGSTRKITENNKALPMDRVYFVYNGFKNALTTSVIDNGASGIADMNVDRYTLGFEKTFWDGTASFEIRMPFVSGFQINGPGLNLESENIGDVTMFTKQVLYADDEVLIAAGLGISLPTGSDVEGQINGQDFAINNQAVHLLPYIGFLTMPSDDVFIQAFLELDFAASGNDITIGDPSTTVGTLTEQNVFLANISIGRWIYQDPEAFYLQRIAAIAELHYATTFQDADVIDLQSSGLGGSVGNLANRVDYLNLTAGLQFQLGPLSNLRVGCVVPLKEGFDRQFDSEVQVSFNRFF